MTETREPHPDFRIIVEHHQERVQAICYRFVRNAADAEDLAQEVFIRVHDSLRHFRGEANLGTWIHRIAVNVSLDFLRRRERRRRFAWLVPLQGSDVRDELDAVAEGDPLADLEERELRRALHAAIDTLPDNQKAAIILCRFEHFTSKEIAEILGTTPGAVDSLLHRALQNIRRRLEKKFSDRAQGAKVSRENDV